MTARPFLLDTSVLLHLIRGRELGQYINVAFDLANVVHRPLVSIVTHGEVWVLADRNGWGEKKRDALTKMLDSLVTVDLDDQAILDAYVNVSRACRTAKGGARVIGDNDLWIAATTQAADAVLLTTDRDFLHLHPGHCFVHWIDPLTKPPEPQGGVQQTFE
jgi:predicted nucleic acid-binding protein